MSWLSDRLRDVGNGLYDFSGAGTYMQGARGIRENGLNWGDVGRVVGGGLMVGATAFPVGAGARGGILAAKAGTGIVRGVASGLFGKPVTSVAGRMLPRPVAAVATGARNSVLPLAVIGSIASDNEQSSMAPKPTPDELRWAAMNEQARPTPDERRWEGMNQQAKIYEEQRKHVEAAAAEERKRQQALQRMVASAGKNAYNSAISGAQGEYDLGKKAAENELTSLLTGLGQQYAGGVEDFGMQAAQMGLDTSPGAYDVGVDFIGQSRDAGETTAREQYAQSIAGLVQELARRRASASAAAANARNNAILQQMLAEYGI